MTARALNLGPRASGAGTTLRIMTQNAAEWREVGTATLPPIPPGEASDGIIFDVDPGDWGEAQRIEIEADGECDVLNDSVRVTLGCG